MVGMSLGLTSLSLLTVGLHGSTGFRDIIIQLNEYFLFFIFSDVPPMGLELLLGPVKGIKEVD